MDREIPPKESQNDASNLVCDQQRRDYYYDDAHGYEKYIPDENEEENESDTEMFTEGKKKA